MTRQGSCLDSLQGDAGNVGEYVDRLVGLAKIIPQSIMEQALKDSGRNKQRSCELCHRTMLWIVLAMGLLTHLPIRQVFKHARRIRDGEENTPARSSLCEARKRLGVEPMKRVFELVVKPLATPSTPGAFYKGMRLVGIDGTILDVPDSDANGECFHRATGGRGDGAFPQVRKVSLVELGTHIEFAFKFGGWQDSEQKLVAHLWDKIPADALLLEDRGFFSYDHWKTLDSRGVKLLVRVKNNMVFTVRDRQSDDSYLAKIYPSSYDRQKDTNGIVVRVIEYTLDDPQRTGHQETHRLMTNLFDTPMFPALELICNYHERWEIELLFDEQKTHLDPRRPSKAAHLRSETPLGVEQELYALSLGHFVVRALMLAAATEAKVDVDRISFTGTLQTLQARLPECDSTTSESLEKWYRRLLKEIACERTEPRRNRGNPRVVKRKMSKFAKKRPHHRGQPPLTKTFAETVVIT